MPDTPESPENAPSQDTLLEFPCAFPLKIMGLANTALAQTVLDVVHRHAPDFDGATMEMRASSSGKYISLTCTINARSKPQLDDLYRELSGHPLVKVVL
jgi:putative lipoic acid-binding regulatory protein